MKINYALMVIVLIAALISCRVTADSEAGVGDTNKRVLSVGGSDDSVNGTAEPTKKGNAVNLDNNDSREQLDPKEKENGVKKGNGGDEGSSSETKKESKKGRLPPVREKCDSSSNRCTDDDKTLVACLIVPGNDSPAALSLLILNKGKGSQSITISAPDSVQLKSKQIELQENKDIEVKVSTKTVENGHSIVLTAGHGNCTLDLEDEVVGTKIDDHSPSSSSFSIFRLTLSRGVVFLGGLVIAGVSVFLCKKSGMKYFARKGLKYQRLDMELPVSHGSTTEGGGNEGWDNSWGDSWEDEEASMAPSLPPTPTLSSRKFKEGWKD